MRVVSLCPSLTESVFALGCGKSLVGRTRFCVLPEDGVAGVQVVGGTKDPDRERVLALRPDLLLMNEEENRREDAEFFRGRGVRVEASFPKGPEDVPGMLRGLGRSLGVEKEGERVARELEERLGAMRETVARRGRRPFVFLIWRKPWMAVGVDTYASRLLEACGGRNVVGGEPGVGGRYPVVELEGLGVHGGELRVLLTSEPYRFAEKHVREVLWMFLCL